jgi:hypothetical protein
MTEKEFDEKWGNVNTDELTDLQLIAFKQDCFEMYEQGGFLDTYQSPYDELEERIGQKFEVVRRATIDNIEIESLPIWLVKFEDGELAYCYPEEITKIEFNRLKGN